MLCIIIILTSLPVPPSSKILLVNLTLFKGAGAQNLGMPVIIGGFILLSFL